MGKWEEKWRKVRELGKGGQGTTYEVESLSNPNQRGVLKLLREPTDVQARARMAKEAINLQTLATQELKVPRLIDHNTEDFNDTAVEIFLVMEFVPGTTLDKTVEGMGGRLSLDQSMAIARDLCATMALMHKSGILHRDLKPANLMVHDLTKPDIVVLDLGLSFDRERKQETLTQTGETMKNELLALPEATFATGDRRDQRSDITNIVAVFFFCLTGHLPGHLRDPRNLAPHKRNGLTMPTVLSGDNRWEQVELLFDVGFSVDIESRFQSICELEKRLTLALTSLSRTKKDPFKLDEELGAKMRLQDRKFQLEEYTPIVDDIAQKMMVHARNYARMKNFTVSFGGVGFPAHPLPAGIDLVRLIDASMLVAVRNRNERRVAKFAVGSKENQCVLLQTSFNLNTNGQPGPIPEWKELSWFDPAKPPSAETIGEWIDEFVTAAMDFLANSQPA